MPSKSEKQRKFFGAVLGRRRSGTARSTGPKPRSISSKEVRAFARKRGRRHE